MTAEFAFCADLARNPRHLGSKGIELVHHGVECFFRLKDFAAHIDSDLFRQVALRDRRGHFGDVAHLAGQVRGHRIHAVGKVLPGAGNAAHQRLAAKLAFGADFARDARHFAGEGVQLIHHRIDSVLQFEDFAPHIDRDLA